ncbi:MAG: EamA family transporter [Oligosphaeraceae bacterium]|nr:EamA family transporter [Oligosphaeraceae bacterium]
MSKSENKPSIVKSSSFWGVAAAIIGVSLFSTVEIASKYVSERAQIDAYMMVFMRFFVTAILLLAFSAPTYLKQKGWPGWKDWKYFIINGLVGIAFSLSFFHLAIDMFENASSSAVVFSANAVFAIVIARFVNNEPWTLQKWCALILALCGVSLFIFEKGTPSVDALKAILVMCLAAMGFAFSVCLTRKVVGNYGASFFMGISSLLGSLFILPVALFKLQGNLLTEIQNAWLPLAYIVFIGTAVAYVFYYEGLKRISAFIASMIFFLKPGLACILAWLIRGEKMNAWTISGTAIILVALLMTLMKKKPRPKNQEGTQPQAGE